MLPVVSTSQPNLFDSAISRLPRIRAWRFSSVMSGSRPSKTGGEHLLVDLHRRARSAGRGTGCRGSRRARARRSACPRRSSATASRPRSRGRRPSASAAISSTSVESIPPERPSTTCWKPFLPHVVAHAEAERGVDLGLGLEQRRDLAARASRGSAARALERARAGARRAARGAPAGAAACRAAARSRPPAGRRCRASAPRSNCGARASTVPSWSITTEWPSKTSSSWPPTQLQNATAQRLSRARWTSIASRWRPLPAKYGEADALTISVAPASASSAAGWPGVQMSSQIVRPMRALPRSSTTASSPAWK